MLALGLYFYEFFQFGLFFLLKGMNLILQNKKFSQFLRLRSSKNFLNNVTKAYHNYNKSNPPLFWFHVSSAGEMEQAIPVARKLNIQLGAQFFVTYYSFSAEPFLKNFPAAIGFSGLPLDRRSTYDKLLEKLPISKIFFIRYDIWPSLIFTCSEKKLEINLLCATKTKTKKGLRAVLSKKWNNIFYKYFTNIFAVSQEDVCYFNNLLPSANVVFAGDAKWARAYERASSLEKTKADINFNNFVNFFNILKETKKILVLGSPHTEEHELALKLISLSQSLFIVYVPHDVEAKSIQSLVISLKNAGYRPALYSQENFSHNLSNLHNLNFDILVLDTIGFLAEVYQIANAAIIGGGFDGQIHNVLEAAAHSIPVLFGSSFERAREAIELVQARAALSFENINLMFHFLSAWVNFNGEKVTDGDASPTALLEETTANARRIFENLPDTSEVVFNVLNKKE